MAIQPRDRSMQFADLMERFEAFVAGPYDDGKQLASIGIGLNIEENRQYLALVLRELRVFAASDALVQGPETEAQRDARYTAIIDGFQGILTRAPLNRLPNQAAGTSQSELALLAALNAELGKYPSASQSFQLSEAQARTIINDIVGGSAIGADLDGNGTRFMDDTGKQARLNERLLNGLNLHGQPYGVTLPVTSREYQALLSMFFNVEGTRIGPGRFTTDALVGNGVLTALSRGQRAEAWWEIRYNSNGDRLAGIAKRRFAESAVFGLYNDPNNVSESEAIATYQMLQLHRNWILDYEAKYGVLPDGTSPGRNMIDGPNGDGANTPGAYDLAGTAYEVDTLVESMDPAKRRIVATLNERHADLNLNADDYLSTNVFVAPGRITARDDIDANLSWTYDTTRRNTQGQEIANNDILIGGGGIDHLTAGAGADVLVGKAGNDTLLGGVGDDIYIFDTDAFGVGDGVDTIRDADGNGRIVVSGIELRPLLAQSFVHPIFQDRPAWRWTVEGRVFDFILISQDATTGRGTLWIEGSGVGLSDRIIVENFQFGDLGLEFPYATLAALLPLGTVHNPFLDPDFVPTPQTTTLAENHARTVTVATSLPARAGDLVRISVAQSGGHLQVLNGTQVLSFTNGYLDLPLEEGQTLLTFSLLSQGDIAQDTTINLSAVVLDASGQPIESSQASLAIDFDEANPAQPTGFSNSVSGTDGRDEWDNNFESAYIEGAALRVRGFGGDDDISYQLQIYQPAPIVVEAGAGDDEVYVHGPSDVWIDGGDGEDLLEGRGGVVTITGGAGSDIMFAYGDDAEVNGDKLFGAAEMSLAAALAAGEEDQSDVALGDLLSTDNATSDDLLVGTGARDLLAGGGGRDTLVGGAGSDLIFGDRYVFLEFAMTQFIWQSFQWNWTAQLVVDGNGNTTFSYEITNYVQYRWSDGNGNLAESTDNFREVVLPGAADVIHAGAGDDYVLAGEGDDFVDGGSGNDVIFGEIGNDTLLGSVGNDLLDAGHRDDVTGADFLDGGDGEDRLWGGHGNDVLYGGAGHDQLVADGADAALGGADYLNGEAGDDKMWGGSRADTLIGGDGNDELYGDSAGDPAQLQGDDYLDGGAGEDLLVGAGGADVLLGGADNDELHGDATNAPETSHGADYLDGGDGNDIMVGGGGADTLIGGEGNDQLSGDGASIAVALHGDDYLNGGAGEDVLLGHGGDDVLMGGDGVDVMSGGDDNDILDGGAGGDTLLGGAGDDILRGGGGADVLQGGAGDDTYVFDTGDLQIVNGFADGIIDTEGTNRVVFSGGIAFADLVVGQGVQAGSITLSSADGTAGLVVRDALSGSVATFQFADGITLTVAELLGRYYEGNADQSSTAVGATLYGGASSDTISAIGNNASIIGGAGNDLLVGGDGSTTYRFERGDGVDTITDASTYVASGGVNRNALQLGYGIAQSDISLRLSAGSTELQLDLGAGDALNLTHAITPADIVNGPRTLDEIRFADGTVSTWQEFAAGRRVIITNGDNLTSYAGTGSSDEIIGSAVGETVDAGAGDDVFASSGGNDTLLGGGGSDTYVFARGAGADTIVNTGADATSIDRLLIDRAIAPGEVNFYRVADSLLVRIGNTTDQVFIADYFGAAWLDEIVLGDGPVYSRDNVPLQQLPQNTLTYNASDGGRTFTINDPADSIFDTLRLGAGILPESVILGSNDYGDLVINFRRSDGSIIYTDRIVITGGMTNPASALNQITFEAAPSVIWNAADVLALARQPTELDDYIYGTSADEVLHGEAGSDRLYGAGGNDVIVGDSGIDWLYGEDGDDTLWSGPGGTGNMDYIYGGAGNDLVIVQGGTNIVSGGAGSDTYLVHRADASSSIDDVDTTATSLDVLRFGPGISVEDVRITRNGSTLSIEISNPGIPGYWIDNEITVWGYFDPAKRDHIIDEFRFTDDSSIVWRYDDIMARTLIGDGADERIDGFSTDDVLRGNGGNDVLNAFEGADDLDGGAGRDQLNGGDGDDVYRFGRNSGSDEIFDASGADRIELAADIAPGDVALYRVSSGGLLGTSPGSFADGLLLVIAGGAHQLLIENYFAADGQARIEEIRFGNGIVWDAATILANAISVAGVAGAQSGTTADDVFDIDHALDTVSESADAGIDTAVASVSYLLPTNVENLTLIGQFNLGGTGNDLNNTIVGNAGDNILDGGAGIDTLIGGAGDDVYWVDQVNGDIWGANYQNFQDIVTEGADAGIDTIFAYTYSAILPQNVERLVLYGSLLPPNQAPSSVIRRFTGNDLDNYIDVSAAPYFGGSPTLVDGGAGADVMVGNSYSNIYVVDNLGDIIVEAEEHDQYRRDRVDSYSDYVLDGRFEDLTLLGSAVSATGNDWGNVLTGNSADNILLGLDGNDTLIGGDGADTMQGGADYDTLDGGIGEDVMYGGAGNDTLNGGDGADSMHGGTEHDILDGGAGDDVMVGGAGSDAYVVDSVGDVIIESANEGRDEVTSSISYTLGSTLENLYLTGSTYYLDGTGNEFDNILQGHYGPNTLDGRAGNDQLSGAGGNDRYVGFGRTTGIDVIFDNSGSSDSIKFSAEQNISIDDLQFSRVGDDLRIVISPDSSIQVQSWFLSASNVVERLTVFDGGLEYTYSSTQMQAMAQGVNSAPESRQSMSVDAFFNRPFQFQIPDNVITDIESQHELSYSVSMADGSPLPAWLTFDAATGAFSGTPTAANAGALTIAVVATDPGGLSVSTSLFLNVTPVTLYGTEGDDVLIGDGGDTILYGFGGNDVLDGGAGADQMYGGGGDDTYIVDQAGDVVTEESGEGDEVRSSLTTYTLGAQVERLVLTVTAVTGIGNALNNVIIGNAVANTLNGGAGNDTLDGGTGNDSLTGGAGNDVFFVDSTNDTINDTSGTETVNSTVTWTLGTTLENLILLGTGNIDGIGSSLANQITGNAGNNTLRGMTGNDSLIGGNGADIYSYSSGHGADTINNASTDTAQDRLTFTNLTRSQVTFSRSGDDLLMARNGSTADSVRVMSWFTQLDTQLDFVQFTDQTLTNAQVNALFGSGLASVTGESAVRHDIADDGTMQSLARLVDAMAHFAGPSRLQIAVPEDASWQDLGSHWLGASALQGVSCPKAVQSWNGTFSTESYV